MRILMLAQFYPPIIGGIELHVRALSIELAARGHEIAVVTIRHAGQSAYMVDHQVRVYRIRSSIQRIPGVFHDSEQLHAPPFPDPQILLELRRILLKEKPQVVHAHNWLGRTFLLLKAWSKAHFIVTLHDYGLICAKQSLVCHEQPCSGPAWIRCSSCAVEHYGLLKGIPTVISNNVMGLLERNVVDLFLAVSNAAATGNGIDCNQKRCRVIPNFLIDDLDPPQSSIQPYIAQLPTEKYLLFVGAFRRAKGVELLLQTYANIKDAPPLVLIGYEMSDWTLPVIASGQKVIVCKNWPHEAVMAAWERCSIGLIPSLWAEPFGLVALEAMHMGKPVIASRIGGLTDIVVENETGLLVPAGDQHALSEAIQNLLADPTRQMALGKMARQRSLEFRADKIIPRIESAYREVATL